MDTLRRRLLLTPIAAALPASLRAAEARWPSRPLRIVVGGVGSVTDIRARWLADRLAPRSASRCWSSTKRRRRRQPRHRQRSRAALPMATRSAIVHQGTMAVNPHLYAHVGYDPLADFAPITRFGQGPLLMTVHLEHAGALGRRVDRTRQGQARHA